ncbi:hypothetical protein V6Z12_A08G132400 [Gossypium hirsutum]
MDHHCTSRRLPAPAPPYTAAKMCSRGGVRSRAPSALWRQVEGAARVFWLKFV